MSLKNGGKKNDPEVFARERKVLEMRLAGVTFDIIGKTVGYASAGATYNAYKRALIRTLQEPADEIRDTELARLDRLMQGIWTQALRGEISSVQTALKIMDRRARLLGLDAPTKQQVDVVTYEGGSELDREIQRLAELLAQGGSKPNNVDAQPSETLAD